MRALRGRAAAPPRTAKQEPLAEGIRGRPFTTEDLETIRQRRPELIQQGLTDKAISTALSTKLHRSAGSIKDKIRKMLKSGELPENPNKQTDFTPEDLATIRQTRAELIKGGLTDKAISKSISIKLQRSVDSIETKIRTMVKSGELPPNPNKRHFPAIPLQYLAFICERRESLIDKGQNDGRVSRLLSEELALPASQIRKRICALVLAGELPENPNKQEQSRFTQENLETIRQTRQALIHQGLTDGAISKTLSKELQRSADATLSQLRKMVKSGELPANPNKQKRLNLTPKDLQAIRQLRPELIQQGLTEFAIAKVLSKELNRPVDNTLYQLRRMVKSGTLPENPNKKKADFAPEDLQAIRQLRPKLIQQGFTDKEISKSLSVELRHTACSIIAKLHKMLQSGELPENPNKQSRFTPQELETIRQTRAKLIRQGLADRTISASLSKSIQRSLGSIQQKINRMLQSGELPENPNKRGRKLPEGEILAQLKEAVGLYTEVSE